MFTKIRAFLWVCVLVMAGFAGTPPSDTLNPASSDAFKKWAIQFAVRPNFTLGTFQGSLLSGRYYFSTSRALQVGVAGNLSGSRLNRSEETPDTTEDLFNIKTNKIQFSVITQYLWIVGVHHKISGTFGVGPFLSYYNNFNQKNSIISSDEQNVFIIKDCKVDFGLTAIVGTDFRVLKNLLLTAFYRWQIYYSLKQEENEYYRLVTSTNTKRFGSKKIDKTNSYDFISNGVFLGITLLF